MRRTRNLRPVAGEMLEDRSVPSGFGGIASRFVGTVPAQDARQVLQAFSTFQQTYNSEVRTILLAPGTSSPSANRAAFDAAISAALGTLNTSIDADIANLPTATTLDATIQDEILGSGTGSLKSLLATIPTPADTSFRSGRSFTRVASTYIGQSSFQVSQQVRSAPAPSGSVDAATVQQDLVQVGTAFQTFSQTYFNNVQNTLLPAGTTNPAANRAAFDQAVGSALGMLNSSINSSLANLPASLRLSLATTVSNDLLSTGAASNGSLQSKLARLSTPSAGFGFSGIIFRLGSTIDIGLAQGRVTRDILTAVSKFNTSAGSMTP